jgi:hypothetical protein
MPIILASANNKKRSISSIDPLTFPVSSSRSSMEQSCREREGKRKGESEMIFQTAASQWG